MTRLFAPFVVILIAGCATTTITPTSKKEGITPALGVTATAPVGGEMYSRFNYFTRPGANLSSDASFGLGLGRVAANAGEPLIEAASDGEVLYCTEKNTYIDPLAGPWLPVCFLDQNKDGQFERARRSGAVQIWADLPAPIAYTKGDLMVPGSGSFKHELLYQGASRSALKLAYREYTDNLARPAFYQDLTYEMEPFPMTITFRTVKIEVQKADNNGITYKVLTQ